MQDLAVSSKLTLTPLVEPLCLDLLLLSSLLCMKVVHSSFVKVVRNGRSTLPMLLGPVNLTRRSLLRIRLPYHRLPLLHSSVTSNMRLQRSHLGIVSH